jgi:DMSO/TMAO reductase YedYZ molybdopterin-dependent catalytic subunit
MGRALRAGRGTNLALLVLLAAAMLTGALAFAVGGAWAWWAVGAHGAAGLGIVLLAPWKRAISARGIRRARPGTAASIALVALVLVAVVTGLAHAVGLWTDVPAMQVHVGSALASIPLAMWHVIARPVRPRRADLSRRSLLRAGALAGGSLAAFGAVEGAVRLLGLPGAERRATGSYERGSFEPAAMPVTQWLNDAPPALDPATWRLDVVGLHGERAWSLDELEAFGDEVRAILDCTGGWFARQDWRGVRLDRLLGDLGDARSVLVVSATGYHRRLPAADAPSLLLAARVGGEPLSRGHGAPVRLVAPGRRGFWWVKWVVRVEASPTPWWWQSPFPLT